MPDYVYRAVLALDGSSICELPLTNVKFTHLLNQAGAWSGELPLNATLNLLDPVSATAMNQVEMVIERDRVPIYAGLVLTRDYDSTSQKLALSGRETWCYLDRRFIDTTSYVNIDQGLIVRDLLTKAAAMVNGDIRIDMPPTSVLTTGVLRSLNVNINDCKPVSEAIEEMAAADRGFEFCLEPYWSSGLLRHTLSFGFPHLGTQSQTLAIFDLPGTIQSYRWQEDGSTQANEIFGIGDDGAGHVNLQRVVSFQTDMPVLQLRFSARAQDVTASLLAQTLGAAVNLSIPRIHAYVTVPGAVAPTLADYHLGDDVVLQINDFRFSNQIGVWRLQGYTCIPPDVSGNPEMVELQLISI
jgi:hypothetical protein